MQAKTAFLALCVSFTLTACGGSMPDGSTPIGQPRYVIANATQAANSVTSNMRIPIQLSQFVPCANGGNGEIVNLSGELHVVSTFTLNANNVHVSMHFQPQGVTGTGSVTGEKYQATGVTRNDFNASNVDFPIETTFVNNFRIIGQGPGNNFLVHEVIHLTVNANSVVTDNRDNFSFQCR